MFTRLTNITIPLHYSKLLIFQEVVQPVEDEHHHKGGKRGAAEAYRLDKERQEKAERDDEKAKQVLKNLEQTRLSMDDQIQKIEKQEPDILQKIIETTDKPAIIKYFLGKGIPKQLAYLSANPNLSPKAFEHCFQQYKIWIEQGDDPYGNYTTGIKNLARNSKTPPHILGEIFQKYMGVTRFGEKYDPVLVKYLIRNPGTPQATKDTIRKMRLRGSVL